MQFFFYIFLFLSPARLASDGRQQIDWSCRSGWSNHISNPQWHVYTQTLRNGGHQRAGAAAPVHRAMRRKIRTFGMKKEEPYRLMRLAAVSAVGFYRIQPPSDTETDTETGGASSEPENADSFRPVMNKSQELPEECWLNVDPHTSQNLCLALIYIGNRAEHINIDG